jgi:hypothetical protein
VGGEERRQRTRSRRSLDEIVDVSPGGGRLNIAVHQERRSTDGQRALEARNATGYPPASRIETAARLLAQYS